MGIYRDLGKNPGVYRILFAQLSARFPYGMFSLLIILHMEHLHTSYGIAGLVLAATSIGQAIAGPLTSRWMGVWGMRPVLILTTIIAASSFALIGFFVMPVWVTLIVSLVLGLSTPPIMPAVRTIYPKMVPGNQLTALFGLDASAQELLWMAGPLLAVIVSAQFTTYAGILVALAFMVLGGAWFIASPELGKVRIPRARRRMGVVLARPTVLIAVSVGLIFISSFAAIEVAIVSLFDHESIEAGVVLGFFAFGSVIGGLLFGHRPAGRWGLAVRLAIVSAGTALTLFSQNPVWLSAVLFFAGLGVAPAIAFIYTMISSTVKFSETPEAFGWFSTGTLIGAALGSALAGFAIDSFGSFSAFALSLLLIVLSTLASIAAVRFIPDLRKGDASPIPDTEPISVHYR